MTMPDAAKPATDEQMEALRAAFAGTRTVMAPLTLLDGEAVTVASILARYDADAAEIKALREAPPPTQPRRGGMASDAESMAICAIRYTIGRQSYIVPSGYAWAREWGARSEWVRRTIADDLRGLVEKCNRGTVGQWLGSPTDERGWREVLRELEAMSPLPAPPGGGDE